jgi:hypothetical protein
MNSKRRNVSFDKLISTYKDVSQICKTADGKQVNIIFLKPKYMHKISLALVSMLALPRSFLTAFCKRGNSQENQRNVTFRKNLPRNQFNYLLKAILEKYLRQIAW